jgi:hypothetical protein
MSDRTVAAKVVSAQSQLVRYVASYLDIPIFADDEPNDLHPDYLALCTALHDSIDTWICETNPANEIGGPRSALPEPEPSTPEHLVTITQQEVLDLIAYIGPDMVVEQLDHGNQHLWIV